MNNYRIDKVKRHNDLTPYRVPCGMNTIIYLDSRPPHRNFLARCKKKHSEAFLCSIWSEREGSFVITSVVV